MGQRPARATARPQGPVAQRRNSPEDEPAEAGSQSKGLKHK